MRTAKRSVTCALAVLAFMSAADAQTVQPAPDSIEGHLAAGKNAAGGRDDTPDFYGLVTAICVAPLNAPPRPDAPAPRMNPNRASAYLEPKKAFDDLYWMGTPSRSTWALTTSDGIILYDTQGVYDAEDVIVGGLKKLGLDPAKVNYVPHFDTYLASVRRFAAIAAAAGATVIMGNQSQFDSAAPKLRMLADRRPGEAHPLDVGAAAVARYFKIEEECAQAVRLELLAQQHDATQRGR